MWKRSLRSIQGHDFRVRQTFLLAAATSLGDAVGPIVRLMVLYGTIKLLHLDPTILHLLRDFPGSRVTLALDTTMIEAPKDRERAVDHTAGSRPNGSSPLCYRDDPEPY
jgi:hypothetical protein